MFGIELIEDVSYSYRYKVYNNGKKDQVFILVKFVY